MLCSPHLWHWADICACGHFPQCTAPWGLASGRMMRQWGEAHMFTLHCLTSFFFFIFFWLFFCCWVSLRLCALRCKHTTSNRRPQKPPRLCFSSRKVCMPISPFYSAADILPVLSSSGPLFHVLSVLWGLGGSLAFAWHSQLVSAVHRTDFRSVFKWVHFLENHACKNTLLFNVPLRRKSIKVNPACTLKR